MYIDSKEIWSYFFFLIHCLHNLESSKGSYKNACLSFRSIDSSQKEKAHSVEQKIKSDITCMLTVSHESFNMWSNCLRINTNDEIMQLHI